jgi:TonB family protein
MKQALLTFLCALCVFVVSPFVQAQDRVVVAGQDGIPAPKRTKTINPSYPQEALAQGVRGIVILEILIDPQGKVASAEVIRSLPLLDGAALLAVRQWEYEVTKVDGQPVSVKLTVPITFALKLPEVSRAPGIPELRQGASIGFPAGQSEGSSVTAQITLGPDGQVAEADVVQGQAPWTVSLLQALRTWRFASEGENVILTFQVEAVFVPPARGDKARVDVRLSNLRRSETMGTPAPAPTALRYPMSTAMPALKSSVIFSRRYRPAVAPPPITIAWRSSTVRNG